MTDNEIKEMLKDIIDNGAEYEYTYLDKNGDYRPYQKYKLGNEIFSNYKYRKVEKYAVAKFTDVYSVGLKSGLSKNATIYFEGTKEECDKWVESNTKKTWLEDYLESDYLVTGSELYIAKTSIKDFCKKILEEDFGRS